MVKYTNDWKLNFTENFTPLNSKRVGRVKSVEKEVKLITKEFDGELTAVKRALWNKGKRIFVSIYCGRICVGTVTLNVLKHRKKIWELAHAVVDKRARNQGLGKYMAHAAMDLAFNQDCSQLYLGAELVEAEHARIFQSPKESGAVRFWKRQNFKPVPMKEWDALLNDGEHEGLYPMKMTSRSKGRKSVIPLQETISKLIPALTRASKAMDNKKRRPMVRICAPGLGDIKITEEKGMIRFVHHK